MKVFLFSIYAISNGPYLGEASSRQENYLWSMFKSCTYGRSKIASLQKLKLDSKRDDSLDISISNFTRSRKPYSNNARFYQKVVLCLFV